MGKRKEVSLKEESDANSSIDPSTPTSSQRSKRNKRKRYNSDEYITDDHAFRDATKSEKTASPTVSHNVTAPPLTMTFEADSPKIQIPVPAPATPEIKASVAITDAIKPLTKSPKSQKNRKPGEPKKKQRSKDSGTSSEEERWLDAIESGKLEEVDDELKKIKPKDPKLMTARQRAMYDRTSESNSYGLMSLPTGYKEKVMTAEAIQKAQIKSQKRKQMADEKREKDKMKTMERLLKKQDSKSVKQMKNRPVKVQVPRISYIQNADGGTISLPEGINFPFEAKKPVDPPKPVLCGMPNCKNIKKYNCSKTNTPLCSFGCYKKNFEMMKRITC
ncbi:INO80 complex subunit B [Culicoides brevitarsis]|uniref:INO80 complex subunit B n=1 Tax=Culicoides brevitarsis TaxID=469753 RepID=UPI00307CBD64